MFKNSIEALNGALQAEQNKPQPDMQKMMEFVAAMAALQRVQKMMATLRPDFEAAVKEQQEEKPEAAPVPRFNI